MPQEYGTLDPSNQAATYPQRISPERDTFGSDNWVGHDDPHTELYEGKEERSEIEALVKDGLPPIHKKALEHVFFLFRPFIAPILRANDKLRDDIRMLVGEMRKQYMFDDTPANISTNVGYEVNYLNHRLLYILTQQPLTIVVAGNAIPLTVGVWYPLTYPRGTRIFASGISDQNPVSVMVRACDEPLALFTELQAGSSTIGNVGIETLNAAGTLEQLQSNRDSLVLLSSSSYGIGTQNSGDQVNINGKGAYVYLNVTAIGTGTVTLHIQGKDQNTGTYYDILVEPTAIAANGFFVYEVYPGITAIASPGTVGGIRQSASNDLPRTWKVTAVVATGAVTFSITSSTLV